MAMLSLDVIQIPDYNIFCTMCRCSSVVEQRIRNARVGGSNPLSGSSKRRRPEIYSGRFLFWLQFWLQTMPNRTFLESQSRTIDLCRKSPPIKMRHGNIYICTHFVYYVSTNAKRCCA